MPDSPDWAYNLTADYYLPFPSRPYTGFVRATWYWRDDVQFSTTNVPLHVGDSYGTLDISLGIAADDGRYSAQVFVRNALDAVGEGGEILFASERREESEVVLRVADSGPGIPDAIRGSLFEPFVTHDKAGGTGLGLAIVKKIVSEHEGRVWERRWDLQGACFHLALPLGSPDERVFHEEERDAGV